MILMQTRKELDIEEDQFGFGLSSVSEEEYHCLEDLKIKTMFWILTDT